MSIYGNWVNHNQTTVVKEKRRWRQHSTWSQFTNHYYSTWLPVTDSVAGRFCPISRKTCRHCHSVQLL